MDASMTKSGEQYKLALERRFSHAMPKVWRAITEREFLHQWFPAHVIGEWEVGAALRFEFQHGEGDGLSEEEFSWGKHILRFELIADGDGCRLLLSESFEDASWGARNAAGWEWCLENLDTILQGGAAVKFVMEMWQDKFEHYVKQFQDKFGPQAGAPESAGKEDS